MKECQRYFLYYFFNLKSKAAGYSKVIAGRAEGPPQRSTSHLRSSQQPLKEFPLPQTDRTQEEEMAVIGQEQTDRPRVFPEIKKQ